MNAVETQHAGVASGINNAVARVAGLLAIAVFGILLIRTFDAHAKNALDELHLAGQTRAAIDRELPKLAAADVTGVVDPVSAHAVHRVIAGAFVSSFRVIMLTAAGVAVGAAAAGASLRA